VTQEEFPLLESSKFPTTESKSMSLSRLPPKFPTLLRHLMLAFKTIHQLEKYEQQMQNKPQILGGINESRKESVD